MHNPCLHFCSIIVCHSSDEHFLDNRCHPCSMLLLVDLLPRECCIQARLAHSMQSSHHIIHYTSEMLRAQELTSIANLVSDM
jgi:hypothetical protein